MSDSKLIFDLGFHNGNDSAYYMDLGYRVVGVEANPSLYDIAQRRFIEEIKSKNLILLNNVISEGIENIPFYINETRTEISSIYKNIAEQDGEKCKVVLLSPTTIFKMIDTFDVPHYMKVDIEGVDELVAHHLTLLPNEKKPQFVSFEISQANYSDIFYNLKKAGYQSFQLRNQANNKEFTSGDFGFHLPRNKWLPFDECLSRYVKFRELRLLDRQNLSFGWLDLHASLN